jgi:hypothetical protein
MKTIVFVLSITLAGYGFAHAEPPAKQPTPKAVTRANDMKQAVRHFGLHLTFRGESDKPYYHLILSVQGGWGKPDRFYQQAKITQGQAVKIIDHLVAYGFFDRAAEAESFTVRNKPSYTMSVHIDDNGDTEDLGWGLPMLKRLDGLRRVLDGDAAKQMDLLLGRLAGHRKEWEKEEIKAKPAEPSEKQADPGKPPTDSRTKGSMKGWELYVWQKDGDTYYSLMMGTNRLKTDDEIAKAAIKGLDAIKPKLDELKAGEEVFIVGKKLMEPPPKDQATPVVEYGKKLGLKVQGQSQ